MKITKILTLATALTLPFMAMAADSPQKREMRSAWVATVWQLDWPQNVVTETGNERQISVQQRDMRTMLDSLSLNNFNAINFQVRSRSDAMYRSSYEPWSSDLVKTRGLDPGWDPLEWVVEECHKRGLECHAWINPYRYETVLGQWNGTPNAYRDTHPEWLLDVNGASILNPGLPEVTDRICDIIKEIVTNYDVDGVLFDDYFYLSGTNESHDGNLYNAYKANGGTLGIGDWRRENVNNMIDRVYRTIKSVKPWVRFGVSPAGIACTSASVANKYGIPKCPTGSDWQYNDIYSDPIAWISRQSLDFISPQVYWTLSASTNYGVATEWWSMVANKWNRHLYVSHSISSLTPASHIAPNPETNTGIAPAASGSGAETYAEYANEVRANRNYDLNDAPGSIFYSAKYLYRQSPKFSHYLKKTVFNTKALVPAMTWMNSEALGLVQNLKRNGSTLSWDGVENVRYTVYAFPESMPVQNFMRDGQYLLGTTYEPTFTLPAGQLAGMQYAVCILDRYGNEYSPALLGVPATALDAPVAVTPANGSTIEAPFDFEWTAVDGATEYIIEIAGNEAMTERIDQRSVNGTTISTENLVNLPIDRPVYWRVRACGNGTADGVSAVYSVNVRNLLITAPANYSIDMSLTPTIEYSIPEREVILEVSKGEAFNDKDIVVSISGKGGSVTVPRFSLQYAKTYYARLRYERAGVEKTTDYISFTTAESAPVVPTIAFPTEGGVLHSDEHIILSEIEGASSLTLQVAASQEFPPRTIYTTSKVGLSDMTDPRVAGDIKIGGKTMVDGGTYYARALSAFATLPTGSNSSEYSPVRTFTYSAEPAGITDVTTDNGIISIEGNRVTVLTAITECSLINAAGAYSGVIAGAFEAGDSFVIDVPAGVYVLRAKTADRSIAVKIAIP